MKGTRLLCSALAAFGCAVTLESMSIFDLIPTVGEVFSKLECTLTDHNWDAYWKDGKKVIYCRVCGKVG